VAGRDTDGPVGVVVVNASTQPLSGARIRIASDLPKKDAWVDLHVTKRRLIRQATHGSIGCGTGRPVTEKFVPPEGFNKSIYFGQGTRSLVTAQPEQPRPDNYDQMTKRQQQQWLNLAQHMTQAFMQDL